MSYAKIVALVASAARPPLPLRSKAYLRASSSSRKRSGGRSGAERGRRARAGGRPRRRRPFPRPRSRAPSQQEEQGEKATDGGRREAEPAGLSVNLEAPWERAGGRWRCRAGVRAGAFLEWRAFFFFSSFLSRDVGRKGRSWGHARARASTASHCTVTLSPFGARATLSLALSAWSHLVTASVVRAPSPSPPPPSSPSSAASCVVLGLLSPCTASCHCQPLTLPRARSLHFCCCCQSRSVVLLVGWMEEERSEENWFNW